MIFISLGTQKFQFNRLLIAIDELIINGVIKEKVIAQVGYSDYQPKQIECVMFMNRDEFAESMSKSRIIITHGGTGAIVGAVRLRKKVIAVPRLCKYGEHVDDHQLQIIQQFDKLGIICGCYNMDHLEKSLGDVEVTDYLPYVSNTTAIIDDINSFIQKITS